MRRLLPLIVLASLGLFVIFRWKRVPTEAPERLLPTLEKTLVEPVVDPSARRERGATREGGRVVINELSYNPPTRDVRDEWIELFNSGERAVDLGGWRFAEGVLYEFPAGTSIEPGEHVVVRRALIQVEPPARAP